MLLGKYVSFRSLFIVSTVFFSISVNAATITLDFDSASTGADIVVDGSLNTPLGTITLVEDTPGDASISGFGSGAQTFPTDLPFAIFADRLVEAGSSGEIGLVFDFDVVEITFNFGGGGGGFDARVEDINGNILDSISINSLISSGLAPGPQTFSANGIRALYFDDPAAGAAIDNVIINDTITNINTYSVGGSASGLSGNVTLQNNSADDLVISANGSFTFSTMLVDLSPYLVTVFAQPSGQTCQVNNGNGTISAANITNITVTCVDDVVPTYTVGGTTSGLTGTGLQLQNNAADTLSIAADGAFVFATSLTDNSAYMVTISTQPVGQTCSVSNGNGNISAANVANVAVDCVDDQAPPVIIPQAPATPIPTLSGLSMFILLLLFALVVVTNRKQIQ